jgi:hypothetical protein
MMKTMLAGAGGRALDAYQALSIQAWEHLRRLLHSPQCGALTKK